MQGSSTIAASGGLSATPGGSEAAPATPTVPAKSPLMIEKAASLPAEKRLWMLTSVRSITSFCVRRSCSSITFSLSRCVIKSWNSCRVGPTSPNRAEASTGSAGQQTGGL
eukprot:scaffold34005_cov63-Phaeocystis_antarctica.AAC.4